MQEKSIPSEEQEVYSEIIKALDNYFNKTCDVSKERMKFREMRMQVEEPFEDWILRLETQAKFCEFNEDQHREEFLQAVLRRSIPGISDKLYEMSEVFDRKISKIVNHGQHLDFIRRESIGLKQNNNENVNNEAPTGSVNALHRFRNRKSFEGNRNIKFHFRHQNNWNQRACTK